METRGNWNENKSELSCTVIRGDFGLPGLLQKSSLNCNISKVILSFLLLLCTSSLSSGSVSGSLCASVINHHPQIPLTLWSVDSAPHHSDVSLCTNFEFESFLIWRKMKNVWHFKCSNKTAVFDLFLYYYDIYFYM